MTRKPASKLRIPDDYGRVICNAAELNERVTHNFGRQLSDPSVMESPLTMPITPVEVQRAISKLNSGRACGHDDLPADLLKSTADLIAPSIAAIFNDALEHHEPLDIGKVVLILLQKPGKPVGPLTSVPPIASTIGTPQGDSLSPVSFTVYLEAALRDLRSRVPPRPPADDRLPLEFWRQHQCAAQPRPSYVEGSRTGAGMTWTCPLN